MKKVIAAILPLILLFCFVGNANAVRLQEVGKKWDAVSVAINTDWFAADLGPIERNLDSVKHTFQFMCPTTTVVNLQMVFNSVTKSVAFNSGVAIDANNGYQFSVMIPKNTTYNIQHATGTQNCSVVIIESMNADF